MTSSVDDTHENEFGVLAEWTAEVLVDRDETSLIAGACRGSGSPAALAWLAESLRLEPGVRLLDVGAGLGGPVAWAVRRYGVTAVASEPMAGACRGGAALFGHPVVRAAADSLPVATAAVDAVWLLGVLDTIADTGRVLSEVRRVLAPTGRCGVLAYVADGPVPPGRAPEGNHFRSADSLVADLAAAGLEVVDRTDGGALPEAPLDWQVRQEHVERRIAEHHRDDPRWREATEREAAFGRLLGDGTVTTVLLHAVGV